MPVSTGKYANTETNIYRYLTSTLDFNIAIACGILANVEYESLFNHELDSNDEGVSYGLLQFRGTRKQRLLTYCSNNKLNYNTVKGQLAFLNYEFHHSASACYKKLKALPNSSKGAYDAGHIFCTAYLLRDANAAKIRGNEAQGKYWIYYEKHPTVPNSVVNLGQKIVQIARDQVGKTYSVADKLRKGPENYDCSGLVYYSYNQAGYKLGDMNSEDLYKGYKAAGGRVVSVSKACAGDLLFYKNTIKNRRQLGITHVAIYNGAGGAIEASPKVGVVRETKSIGDPYKVLRIIADEETSQGKVPTDTSTVGEYVALSSYDKYATAAKKNLAYMAEKGYDAGYLIDMDHGGKFKFYIPEFTETAGANWANIDIIGRSVTILSYNNTNSKTISISLELFAGVGRYSNKNSRDIVGDMHDDANFVKSLEYPDYSNTVARPPATVQLILGSAVNIVGVVKGVSVEHKRPYDEQKRSMYLKVSFTVVQTAINPIDYSDVRAGRTTLTTTSNMKSILNTRAKGTDTK